MPTLDTGASRRATDRSTQNGGVAFATTHWSVVLAARGQSPSAQEALEKLCRTYWWPIYGVRQRLEGDKAVAAGFEITVSMMVIRTMSWQEKAGRCLFLLCCLTWASVAAQTEEKSEAQTSPKGTFKIESATKPAQPPLEGNDVVDFVVSTSDASARELLNEHPEEHPTTYIISPDEKWIFASSSYGSRMAGGDLFKREEGLKFKPVEPQSLAELTWRFFAQQEKIDPEKVPFLRDQIGIIDFVAWSPDSGRLLVGLRGGDFDEKVRQRGVYLCYAYFNTRTESFELTDYLRRLNKGAWKRFKDEKLRADFGEAASAEPLGELPLEAESKKRCETADRRVKESFQKLLDLQEKQLQQSIRDEQTSATQRQIYEEQLQFSRDIQRGWIKTREIGARLYADSGAKSTAVRRYWQYMADSTEARASEIERELKEGSSSE